MNATSFYLSRSQPRYMPDSFLDFIVTRSSFADRNKIIRWTPASPLPPEPPPPPEPDRRGPGTKRHCGRSAALAEEHPEPRGQTILPSRFPVRGDRSNTSRVGSPIDRRSSTYMRASVMPGISMVKAFGRGGSGCSSSEGCGSPQCFWCRGHRLVRFRRWWRLGREWTGRRPADDFGYDRRNSTA